MIKKYLLLTSCLIRQVSLFAKESKRVCYIVLTLLFSLIGIQTTAAQDSFETDFDGWINITGDQIDWTRITGATGSTGTGPTTGSDGTSYLYIETSDPVANGDIAWLEKDFDFTSKKNARIKFDYHMFGDGIGNLNVFVNKNGVLTSIFSQSGDKGDAWISSPTIDLSSYDGEQIKIRFEASKGSNFRSDTAIDNVSVASENSDTDNDGILDDVDLDDDNDGILDTDEGCETVASTAFNLVSAESVLGDVNSGGKLVYKDTAGNTVILEAAGTAGNNNGITTGSPNDGTIITDITNGNIAFEIGANDVNDQPKLKVSAFTANGIPFKIKAIGLGGIGNMDNSEAQDAIAIDVAGKWSNLTSTSNTLGSAQIITSPPGATTIPGNNSTTQAELDAFDFTNMVAQGAVSEIIYNNADNNVQFGYNATFTPTNPTSAFNIIVDDINTSGTGRNILAELSTTSITVESIICRDTDGDGIPDNIDSDSDNDGCSDANEAYFGSVSRADNDDDGFYGTGTPVVDSSGRVSGASYSSPNAYYIDGNVSACYDTDNDGVPNSVDLDDDNDGILDTVECSDINFSKNLIITNAKSGNLTVVEGGASGTPYVTDAGPNNDEVGLRYIDQAANPTFYRLNTKGKDFSYINGNNLVFRIFLEDPNEDYFGGTTDIRLGSGATQLTLDLTQDPYGQTKPTVIGDYKITVALTAANFNVSQAAFDAVISALDYIDIRGEFWLGPTQTLESELIPLLSDPCDFDGDGIPNELDSDSDGDGCSDADEAYYGAVTNADSNNNGFYGSGTPTVDSEGKVVGAAYTSSNAYYLDASVNTCEDNDNDGVIDSLDVDDDNDGILDTDECPAPVVYNDSFEIPDLDALGPSGLGDVSRPDGDADGEADMFLSQTSIEGWDRTDNTNSFDIAYDIYNSSKGLQSIDLYGTPGATGIQKTFSGFTENVAVDFSVDYSSVAELFEATVSVDYGAGAVLLTTLKPSTTATTDSPGVVGARISTVVWVNYTASLLPTATGTIKIIIQSSSFGSGQTGVLIDNVVLSQTSCPDKDGDLIPDKFDTDSDNDGCPDAIEAAGSLTLDKLTTFIGGSTGGSSKNLGINVDTNGSPIVSGQGVAGYTQNQTAAVTDANINTACSIDLSITKTVDKPVLKLGQTVVFTLVLKNEGLQAATNVQVKDLLPTGLIFSSATVPANTTYTAGTGIWDLSTLTIARNQTIELKIAATVNTVGAIITNKTEIFNTTETDIDSIPNDSK